jgi:predicted dehydrogenase
MPPALRIGMIGHGFMGKMHGHAWRSLGFYYDPPPVTAVPAAVATRTEASWRDAVGAWGYESGTTDFREICAREDIDVIDCSTPNAQHRDVLFAALENGKHCYMDKPLATSMEDAIAMAQCAAAHPECITQMTFQYRFVPALMRAKELIDAGRLGRIFSVRTAYLHAGYTDPARPFSWRLDKDISGPGGALFDLGSHVADLTRHLAGEFREVMALNRTFITERPLKADPARKMPVDVDDVALLQFTLENGATGTLEASRMATGTQDEIRFEMHGDRGAIRFNLLQPDYLEFYDAEDPGGDYGGERGFKAIECVSRYPAPAKLPGPKMTIGWERFHVHGIYLFARAIAEGRPAQPDIIDGAKTQAVLQAALDSAETGRPVKVDLSRIPGKEKA